MSDAGFPFGTGRWISIASVPVLALRLSYVGDLGWELHARALPARAGTGW